MLSPLRSSQRWLILAHVHARVTQADGVKNVIDTMSEMYGDSRALQQLEGVDMRSPEDSVAPMVRVLTMLKNRDYLLGYLRHRMERIEARLPRHEPAAGELYPPLSAYTYSNKCR